MQIDDIIDQTWGKFIPVYPKIRIRVLNEWQYFSIDAIRIHAELDASSGID